MSLGETPGQTVGPFFSIGMAWLDGGEAVPDGDVVISGRVLDGAGAPVPDAVVETWQLNPDGFGRSGTDDDGRWRIRTVKPVGAPGAAPNLAVLVFARGLLHRIATRIYFGDETDANASDATLLSLPDDAARATLIARPTDAGYHLDLHLQGAHETAFFSV